MKPKFAKVISAAILAVSSFTACTHNKKKDSADAEKFQYKQISQEEAKKIMDSGKDIIILDARTKEEYAEGHIKNAVCIPVETISKVPPAELPDKSRTILVYCRSGRRSKVAAEKLAAMGYSGVLEFGGILTWAYGTEK